MGHSRTRKVQDHHQRLLSQYRTLYPGSQAVIIVYDKTDPSSFREIEGYWLHEARNNSDPNIHLVVAGNKSDMPAQISDAEVTSLTHSIGTPSYAVSAKTGDGVETMFREICEALVKRFDARVKEREEVKLRNKVEPKKTCCKWALVLHPHNLCLELHPFWRIRIFELFLLKNSKGVV